MKLSPKQAKILSFTQLDSRLSAREIASGTGLREHSVVFGLKSLQQTKLISPFVMANLHGLGLTDYCIFLNYSGKGKGIRTKILKYCIASPQTAYVAELSGAYQVSLSLFARSIFEVEDFFSELSDVIPEGALSMNFAIRSEWTVLPRRYFDQVAKMPKPLSRGRMSSSTIDEIDLKILKALCEAPSRPVSTTARELKLPETTFRHRVRDLEKRGLIVGYPYEIDTVRLGLSPIRLLIVARDKSRRFRDELFKFVGRTRVLRHS